VTTLHEFGGMLGRRPLDTFLLGSHNSMVTALGSCVKWPLYTRALHWVPISMPMPTHAHGFRVGMGAMLLFMGGHGWASGLCNPASNSKSESNFLDAGNTLTKKRSGLKPTIVNDLLFVRSNQDLV
jgi:hypothetical protein